MGWPRAATSVVATPRTAPTAPASPPARSPSGPPGARTPTACARPPTPGSRERDETKGAVYSFYRVTHRLPADGTPTAAAEPAGTEAAAAPPGALCSTC